MKTLVIVLGLSVITSLSIPNPVLQTKQPQTAPAAKVRTGTISIDERHFIDEGDLKVWSVTNTNVLNLRGNSSGILKMSSLFMGG